MSETEKRSGFVAEEWVKEFAKSHGILSNIELPLERVVKQLDEKLQFKLSKARPHLAAKFAFANEWIDSILHRTGQATGRAEEKAGLAALLLDYAMATDTILALRDNHGKQQVIAVDVTSNPQEEQYKLNTIRGQRDPRDLPGFNQNANIAAMRKELGIDKHLVLVINSKNPPEPALLLQKLYAFANQSAKTASINLFSPLEISQGKQQENLPAQNTPQELWHKYDREVKANSPLQRQIEIATKALSDGHAAKLPDILACDPFVRQMQREQGTQKARYHISLVINAVTRKLEAFERNQQSPQQEQKRNKGPKL